MNPHTPLNNNILEISTVLYGIRAFWSQNYFCSRKNVDAIFLIVITINYVYLRYIIPFWIKKLNHF